MNDLFETPLLMFWFKCLYQFPLLNKACPKIMNIQICSDLHLEFEDNRDWIYDYPLQPKADILIVAGDTFYLEDGYLDYEFLDDVSEDFKTTYLLPGNHEYYGGYDVSTAIQPTFRKLRKNVFLVNNQAIKIGNYQFIFSTMWSEINQHAYAIMEKMADFWKINYQGQGFNTNHFNFIHDRCFNFIKGAIRNSKRNVVVTHHLPSRLCNSLEFRNSLLNDAFCVDKTRFIEQAPIDCWIYGHSHRNMPDFEIGGTKMCTNQLGYIGISEHQSFKRDKVIRLK